MCHLILSVCCVIQLCKLPVGGEKEEMDKAVTIVEPVAREYIEKWKKENKEQVK